MSSSAETPDRRHPIAVAAARVEEQFEAVAEQATWSMTGAETRATLLQLTRLRARVQELELRVAAQADGRGVGEETGARSTAVWWAHQSRMTQPEAHRMIALARALDTGHEPVRAALAAGDLLPDQARVLVESVDALPDEIDPAVSAEAERFLLTEAKAHDAIALRRLGKRLLEVVDPETADRHEAETLEREEAAAQAAASLQMIDDGHGRTHGRFTIPTLQGAMLKKALLAIAAPKRRAAVDGRAPVWGRPSRQRLGQAFCELIAGYPAARLPQAGGTNATVVVTMTLESLLGGLKAASLDTGERLSAAEARRIACRAGLVPAVLDSEGQVLDLGRERRYYSKAQRLAFALEQGGCAADGCDAPPGLTHAHHPERWSDGGPTNRDGLLLCPRHHHLAHHPGYAMTEGPGRSVAFHRRT